MLNLQKSEKESEKKESEDPESAAKPSAPALEDTEAAGSCEAAETADTRNVLSHVYFSMRKSSHNCKRVSKSNIFHSQVRQR